MNLQNKIDALDFLIKQAKEAKKKKDKEDKENLEELLDIPGDSDADKDEPVEEDITVETEVPADGGDLPGDALAVGGESADLFNQIITAWSQKDYNTAVKTIIEQADKAQYGKDQWKEDLYKEVEAQLGPDVVESMKKAVADGLEKDAEEEKEKAKAKNEEAGASEGDLGMPVPSSDSTPDDQLQDAMSDLPFGNEGGAGSEGGAAVDGKNNEDVADQFMSGEDNSEFTPETNETETNNQKEAAFFSFLNKKATFGDKSLKRVAKSSANQSQVFNVCRNGTREDIAKLYASGFDVNMQDANGVTPLMIACYYSNAPVASFLVKHCFAKTSIKDKDGRDAFDYCKTPALKKLIDPYDVIGDKSTDKGTTDATSTDTNVGAVSEQVKNQPNTEAPLDSAKQEAAPKNEYVGMDQEDLDHELCLAVDEGNYEAVRKLIEAGADVNEYNNLICAVRFSKGANIIKLLIDSGANIDIRDINGRTALDWAKQINNIEVVKILEEAGASNSKINPEASLFSFLTKSASINSIASDLSQEELTSDACGEYCTATDEDDYIQPEADPAELEATGTPVKTLQDTANAISYLLKQAYAYKQPESQEEIVLKKASASSSAEEWLNSISNLNKKANLLDEKSNSPEHPGKKMFNGDYVTHTASGETSPKFPGQKVFATREGGNAQVESVFNVKGKPEVDVYNPATSKKEVKSINKDGNTIAFMQPIKLDEPTHLEVPVDQNGIVTGEIQKSKKDTKEQLAGAGHKTKDYLTEIDKLSDKKNVSGKLPGAKASAKSGLTKTSYYYFSPVTGGIIPIDKKFVTDSGLVVEIGCDVGYFRDDVKNEDGYFDWLTDDNVQDVEITLSYNGEEIWSASGGTTMSCYPGEEDKLIDKMLDFCLTKAFVACKDEAIKDLLSSTGVDDFVEVEGDVSKKGFSTKNRLTKKAYADYEVDSDVYTDGENRAFISSNEVYADVRGNYVEFTPPAGLDSASATLSSEEVEAILSGNYEDVLTNHSREVASQVSDQESQYLLENAHDWRPIGGPYVEEGVPPHGNDYSDTLSYDDEDSIDEGLRDPEFGPFTASRKNRLKRKAANRPSGHKFNGVQKRAKNVTTESLNELADIEETENNIEPFESLKDGETHPDQKYYSSDPVENDYHSYKPTAKNTYFITNNGRPAKVIEIIEEGPNNDWLNKQYYKISNEYYKNNTDGDDLHEEFFHSIVNKYKITSKCVDLANGSIFYIPWFNGWSGEHYEGFISDRVVYNNYDPYSAFYDPVDYNGQYVSFDELKEKFPTIVDPMWENWKEYQEKEEVNESNAVPVGAGFSFKGFSKKADTNSLDEQLFKAIYNNDLTLAKSLLEQGADPVASDAFDTAMQSDKKEAVRIMLPYVSPEVIRHYHGWASTTVHLGLEKLLKEYLDTMRDAKASVKSGISKKAEDSTGMTGTIGNDSFNSIACGDGKKKTELEPAELVAAQKEIKDHEDGLEAA